MNIPELIERLREWPTGLDLTDIDKAVEALFAQQAVIEQMCEALAVVLQCRPIGYETMTEARERKIREALALQHSLTALREHDAEVCQEFANFLGIEKREDVVKWIGAVRKGEV